MATIMITGGAGFIGLNVSLELIKNENNIVIVDDLKNSYVSHINHLIKRHPNHVKFYKGNVCDEKVLNQIFKDNHIDIVLHLAARKYVAESIKKPREYEDNNLNSLKNVLNFCELYNIKKFAFASTSVVYGNATDKPFTEGSPLCGLNPYANTKIEGEKIISAWHAKTKIPTIIFRFTNPVGANVEYMLGDHSKKRQMQLIPYVVRNALNNNEILLRGNDYNTPDGTPIRSFLHITDLASAVVVTITKFAKDIEIYNIGNPKLELSTMQIITSLQNVLGKKVKFSFTKSSNKENAKISCNCDKLKKDFGFSCQKNIEEILLSQIKFEEYISTHFENKEI